jgi:hypothetical protein
MKVILFKKPEREIGVQGLDHVVNLIHLHSFVYKIEDQRGNCPFCNRS